MSLSIFIVDDNADLRDGVRELLTHHGFCVSGVAADGMCALAPIAQLRPDIVLCDISMPGMSGVTLVATLRSCAPQLAVIVLSAHQDAATIHAALAAGAQAFVPKRALCEELISAIERVAVAGRQSAAALPSVYD